MIRTEPVSNFCNANVCVVMTPAPVNQLDPFARNGIHVQVGFLPVLCGISTLRPASYVVVSGGSPTKGLKISETILRFHDWHYDGRPKKFKHGQMV